MPLTKEQKRFRLQFRRRKETFLRTAHKFHLQLRSQVYLMIIFEGRFYVYSSVDHKAWPTRWPPPLKNIVSLCLPPFLFPILTSRDPGANAVPSCRHQHT